MEGGGIIDRKRDLIEEILKTQSDEEEDQDVNLDVNRSINKVKFKRPEDYLQYTFHIPKSLETNTKSGGKTSYVIDEAVSDLGFSSIASMDFWLSISILVITGWIRSYLHSFGSWVFLLLASVSISSFKPTM